MKAAPPGVSVSPPSTRKASAAVIPQHAAIVVEAHRGCFDHGTGQVEQAGEQGVAVADAHGVCGHGQRRFGEIIAGVQDNLVEQQPLGGHVRPIGTGQYGQA